MAKKQTPAMEERTPHKVVPRGTAIVRTDAELDAMTTPEALMALQEDAAADFREKAPRDFKTLLDTPK